MTMETAAVMAIVVEGGKVDGIDSNNTNINRRRNLNRLLISAIDPNAITECLW